MNEVEYVVFSRLFKESAKKCFGHELTEPLSETECKLFSMKILEDTGLVVGGKSLKNYSIAIVKGPGSKTENPSVPSLDTLARYVLNAPYTDEVSRKNKESHYPYWFEYKNRVVVSNHSEDPEHKRAFRSFRKLYGVAIIAIIAIAVIFYFKRPVTTKIFLDDFNSNQELLDRGWLLKDMDTTHWSKRNEKPGWLALFTLQGDNWPDKLPFEPSIKNLVYRPVNDDCFMTEINLNDFIPRKRWQQAGILLMEDSNLAAKSVRLSISYNDYFGGYTKSPEVLIQAIISSGKKFEKPEEFAHYTLFTIDSISVNPGLLQNFNYTSLRIEKKGTQFRFLYAGGSMGNSAFHEIVTKIIDFQPKYIGIFALKGYVNDTTIIPAYFNSFQLSGNACP